jgi:hypothetical protein
MALTLEFRPHNSCARRHDLVIITQIGVQRDEPVAGDLAATSWAVGPPLAMACHAFSARRRRRLGLVRAMASGVTGLLPEAAASAAQRYGGSQRAKPVDRGGGSAHG